MLTTEHWLPGTADQELDEGPTRTLRDGHEEKGNPFREQQANVGSERHEGKSGIENDPSWVAARCPDYVKSFYCIFPKFFASPERFRPLSATASV